MKLTDQIKDSLAGINTIHGGKLATPKKGVIGEIGGRKMSVAEGGLDGSKPATSEPVGNVGTWVVKAEAEYAEPPATWPPAPPTEAEQALTPWLSGQFWSHKPAAPAKAKDKKSDSLEIL